MAWPLTALRTYVANTTPTIRAADLNSIQDAINRAFGATYSFKALLIDGTGGAVVAGRAGTAKVSAADSGTTAALPTTTVAIGEFGKGLVPIGWAKINGVAGTLARGVNVRSEPGALGGAGHPIAGQYTIVFNTGPSDFTNTCVVGTCASAAGAVRANTQNDGAGRLQINALVYNNAFGLADIDFCVIAFAE